MIHKKIADLPSPDIILEQKISSFIKETENLFLSKQKGKDISLASYKYLFCLNSLLNHKEYAQILEALKIFSKDNFYLPNNDIINNAKKLTEIPRSSWLKRGINNCENVADHSFGTINLLILLDKYFYLNEYDKNRLIKILVVHDLPKAETGDLITEIDTKYNDITLAEKQKREEESVKRILHDNEEFLTLWIIFDRLYKDSKEGTLARQIDKLEAVIQGYWYWRTGKLSKELFLEFAATAETHLISNKLLINIYQKIINSIN